MGRGFPQRSPGPAGLLAAVLLAVGCGGMAAPGAMPGGAGGAADPGWSWQRDIAPFPVLHEDGSPFEHALLGGFDVPRPQLIDIDDDGDPDLFVQERSNELMFLENTGTADAPAFVWRTDRFAGLDISEWYRFADLDGDGDQDLLAEEPFSHIRWYRNVGSPGEPRFELADDTVRTVAGEPLYSDRQNIPNAVDLDCNGQVDLFIGRLSGTVSRYEAASTDPLRFRLISERFADIEIVNALMGTLHGANTMDFADPDGDGDVDLFWGDFFEPGLLLLENTGTCQDPAISNDPVPFPPSDPLETTGYNAPTVADLDGDGRPDMLVGVLGGAYNPTLSAADNLYALFRTASGYELRTRRFLDQVDLGSETVPAFVDDDGDGDLDLLVGTKIDPDRTATGLVHRFENTGDGAAPSFRYDGPLAIEGAYHYAPEPADLDGDGRPDLLVGTWNDGVLHYRNTGAAGSGRWVLADEPLVQLSRGSHSTPAAGDLDGDGDLDLVVGEASGALNYYRNDGSAGEPSFELVSDQWLEIDVGRRSHPALFDLDEDGDLDLIVGAEDGRLRVFRNQGTATDPRLVEDPGARLPRFPYAAPTFLREAEGGLAVLLGGLSGGLAYFRR